MNKFILFLIVFCSCFSSVIYAQELNAKVIVNSDRVPGTNREVFNSMQSALNSFINAQKWSSTTFATNEKIECSFTIIILAPPSDNMPNYYKTELLIQAQRPVYNSTYTTNLLNFRDTQLDFEYIENTPIDYVETSINNNLVATIAFYSNLILGLDFDSFSPMGGSFFYRKAQSIVSQAQGYSAWSGWAAFEKANNRHGIITAFLDESLKPYRELWYTYHRKGLDEMSANPDRGRTTIIEALPKLDQIRGSRTSTVLLQMFSDSKLSEVTSVCSKATSEEKKQVYDLLSKLYPTMTDQLQPLKK